MTNDASSEMNSVDFSRIQDTSDGDKEFEQELFEAYIEDCEDRIARLREAYAGGNADDLRREAHTIKGASANVGTVRLHEIALQLEHGGDAGAGAIEGLIADIEAEFVLVKQAINGYLAELRG